MNTGSSFGSGYGGYGVGYGGGIGGYGGGYGGGICGYGGGYGGGFNGYGGGYDGCIGGYVGGYGDGYAQVEQAMRSRCMGILHEAVHMDLVVNICAYCLWYRRYPFSLSTLKKCVGSRESIAHPYLYKVLSTNEDHSQDLTARNKSGTESVSNYLARRNDPSFTSQYISTFTSLSSADVFAKEVVINGDPEPKQIVQINVSQLHTATFIDFSKYEVRDALLRNHWYLFNRNLDYMSICNEVLVVGLIPARSITAIHYSDLEELSLCTCARILMLDEKSDLVINMCANCLKTFWMRNSRVSRLYELSCHVSVRDSIIPEHQIPFFLYRVLKESDDTSRGLIAKNEQSVESVKRHVAFGSHKTQYISTFRSLDQAIWFANVGIDNRNPLPKRIVEIDVSQLPTNTFIDFSKTETCEALFRNPPDGLGQMAYNFANKFKEVLVVGRIPAGAITAKYKKWSVESELEPYD